MDKLLSAKQAGWLERSFVAESSGAEVAYFSLSGADGQPGNPVRPRCFLPPPGRCYSFGVPVAPTPQERVRAARLQGTLQRRLEQEAPWGDRGRVLPLLCYGRGGALLEKGFLVQDEQGLPETRAFLEELLGGLLPAPAHLWVYEPGESGRLGCALWGCKGPGKESELLGRANVVAAEEPQSHPACTSIIPESRLILELVDKCPKHPKKGNFPVIVIEGLDGTAYAIATEITGNVQNLPAPHHLVYHWPDDLLSPDIVLLLTVSPEERVRRLQGRGIEKTREEVDLEVNDVFRQKVEESYGRMENPTCHILDANPPKEGVAKAALHLIKNHYVM
ncbi:UMP-CMP kinase 2, mitochondrial, partial [Ophiophagus hannah]